MQIKWRHLIPVTFTVAVLAMAALGFSAQKVTAASCGPNDGQVCRKVCQLMCSPPNDNKCCASMYYYFPSIDN